jgi:ribosomal protein L19E
MLEDKMLETSEVNEVKEPTENVNEHLSREELIERYAQIQKISIEQAQEEVGAPTEEEILKKIQDKTIEKINSTRVPMNRAQRRALKKKVGAKKYAEMVSESGDVVEAVSETAKKLNYIDLIQKLRKLNKEKQENGEAIDEDD